VTGTDSGLFAAPDELINTFPVYVPTFSCVGFMATEKSTGPPPGAGTVAPVKDALGGPNQLPWLANEIVNVIGVALL
jgi:hypothetical protein